MVQATHAVNTFSKTGVRAFCLGVCALIFPLQISASAQSRLSRIAADVCWQAYDERFGVFTTCQIWIADGSHPILIHPGTSPSWTSDGSRVVFTDGIGAGDILVFTLADGTVANLTNSSPAAHRAPRWSPDSAHIAYVNQGNGGTDLFVMNANGTAPTRLTNNLAVGEGFAWSPDGAAIAFAGTIDRVTELYVVRLDGSPPRRITQNVGFKAWHSREESPSRLSWSADGTRIAFNCANSICAVNPDGTNLAGLVNGPVSAVDPAYSPVDGRIAFVTSAGGAVVMGTDGMLTPVAPGRLLWRPTWSSDGASLAFDEEGPGCPDSGDSCVSGQFDAIYTVNADGTGLTGIAMGLIRFRGQLI